MSTRPLTLEEIRNLENNFDRIIQMAAELDKELYEVHMKMLEANKEFVEAKMKLDAFKMEKTTIIERARIIGKILSKF